MRADFITKLRRVPRHVHHSYQIAWRAETCTTACAHKFHLTFSSQEMLRPTLLQNAALVRGLRNSTPMYPTFRPIVLSSFAACGSVHNRSRAWIALYPPGARINLVQAPLRVQHSNAVLVIFLLQHAPSSDGHPYEVMWRAEACTATRAQDYHFIPQQVEPLSLTLLQKAALARGLSDFVTTRRRSRQPRLPSFATCGSVHNRSCA